METAVQVDFLVKHFGVDTAAATKVFSYATTGMSGFTSTLTSTSPSKVKQTEIDETGTTGHTVFPLEDSMTLWGDMLKDDFDY